MAADHVLTIDVMRQEGKEAMSTEVEVGALILVVLFVVYSIRTALSGVHGRPKGPMV
jgi:hypothetical protein